MSFTAQPTPYVRPALQATREGIPSPEIELHQWLDALEELLEERHREDEAHVAYDLLALHAKLRRTRSELLEASGRAQLLARADAMIQQDHVILAELALTTPNPRAWVGDAIALSDSYDDYMDPIERSAWARQLVNDLDDADLAYANLLRLGHEDQELAMQLKAANAWLAAHADVFLSAGVYVQAVSASLRPQLPREDELLAATATKYIALLDALEWAQQEATFEKVSPMSDAQEAALLDAYREPEREVALRHPAWMPAFVAQSKLAAGADPDVAASRHIMVWESPDRAYRAELPLPERIHEGVNDSFALSFYDDQKRRASKLAGAAVSIGNLPGIIDEQGQFRFTYADVLAAGDAPELTVAGVKWLARAEDSSHETPP